MLPVIVAATTAARNQQRRQGAVRCLPPTTTKVSKWVWALFVVDFLAVLTIIVMAALGM